MSISSSVYPIPLTIKNILTDGFNGELVIKGKDLNKSLFFEDGDLIYAKSDIFDERINVILYLLGKISDQQYEYITGLGQSVDLEVGRILIENNFITEDDLFYTTLFQIRKIAVNTFKINQADWELREGNMETPLKQKHRIPLPPIIVEGARKIENISFFMNKIQFLSPRTTEIPEPLNQLMAGDEIVLYKRLHDCKKMSNHEIISKLNLDPVFYWRTLVLFILLDIIDFSKHRLNYDMEEDIHRLIQFQKKLMSGKSNPFEILGIPVSASRSEVKVAFFKLSKIFHPDRFGSAAAPEIKKIARYVFWEIENSYHSLTKKLKKSVAKKEKEKKEGSGEMDFQPEYQQEIEINLENDLNGDEQESVESSEIEIQMNIQDEISMEADNLDLLGEKEAGPYIKPDKAEEKESIQTGVLETREIITEDQENKNSPEELPVQKPSVYERAEKFYTEKNYYEASKVLKSALKSDRDRADYHYLIGLCQTHMEFFQEEAERHLRRAIELNPWNFDPVYALGILFRIQGKKKQAAKCFERVMTMSKDHGKAVKAMRELAQKKKEKGSLFSFLKKK